MTPRGIPLTIKKAEQRHADMIKGQKWIGSGAKYRYNCKKHGIYLQIFSIHDRGHRCKKCAEVIILQSKLTAEGLSKTPEYMTVRGHFYYIFNPDCKSYKNYKGMPFFDEWNPEKGGSWLAGAKWILKNLGARPKGCSMHIVEHEKGFVPGNLEWALPNKQTSRQMFRIIANLKHRIKELEQKLEYQEKA